MARRKQLSKEQILDAITQSLIERGVPPNIEELRRHLKVGSTRTVLRYLRWLEQEGDIARWPGARGIRVLRMPGGTETTPIPLVGVVAAGPLMLAEENIEGWVRLPKEFVPSSRKYFLLRVRGDSMNKALVAGGRVEDGDLVLIRQQATAEPGQAVVAVLDGEATIKKLVRGDGYWVLKPESTNPRHRPILVDRDFRIQGIVMRVFKKGATVLNLSQ